jgi:subtilisin family serine protease
MTFYKGFVAHLSKVSAEKIQKKYGKQALIEEDAVAFASPILAKGKPSPVPVQPAQSVPWGISAIGARDATTQGAGIKVCVVDTGVDKNHPDLAENIAGGRNFVAKGRLVDPNKWADDEGHGTHVSGTIAAVDNAIGVVGVAPRAGILAAKVLNSQGSGYNSWIADGVRFCTLSGAKVINMSLGGSSDSQVLHDAIIEAYNAGVIVVAAAGNSAREVGYPAKYSEVFAVSAVDINLNFASFSNFGPEVAFAAPGVNVLSTALGGGYVSYSGTSMASPHVAGVAALMLSSGSKGLKGRDIGLTSDQQGSGLIDALLTVQNR